MKNVIEILKNKNEIILIYAAICLIGALVCLVLSRYSNIQILGVNAWIKPIKFFLSVAIFSFTMGTYLQYLNDQKQVIVYSWSMVILFTLELIPIVYQASQGKLSHFNIATPFDKFIFNFMAIAITILMLHTIYILTLFFNQNEFTAPAILITSIKLSIIITVLFAFEGFAMGAILRHTIGSEDGSAGLPFVNWSKNHGDLRVAHFFGMHALQFIPLVTFYFAKSKRDVFIIGTIYFVFVTFTLVQAFLSKPFIKF